MNSTHALTGLGGGAFGAALASVIAATWHLDPTVAANWVTVASGVAAFVGGLVVWFVKWKWPDAPPLPDALARRVPLPSTTTPTPTPTPAPINPGAHP